MAGRGICGWVDGGWVDGQWSEGQAVPYVCSVFMKLTVIFVSKEPSIAASTD